MICIVGGDGAARGHARLAGFGRESNCSMFLAVECNLIQKMVIRPSLSDSLAYFQAVRRRPLGG